MVGYNSLVFWCTHTHTHTYIYIYIYIYIICVCRSVYRTSPPQAHYAPAGWLTPAIYVYLLQWGDDYPCGVRLPLGSQWVPYATEGHTASWHFLSPRAADISNDKWSLKLWNAHNNQSIPFGIIWSYVYQTPTTLNFLWQHCTWIHISWVIKDIKNSLVDHFLLKWDALKFIEKKCIYIHI